MSEVKVPDIGDFTDVPVIEVLVSPGDTVAAEDPLIVLESDKASMDVPAPEAGTVGELLVKVGDTVSKGTPILTLESDGQPAAEEKDEKPAEEPAKEEPTQKEEPKGDRADVVVIGSGPGGYTAAFRAADLGLKTVLVERYERLGGVCLNVGCIPSKALLHLAKVLADAEDAKEQGISFGEPEIDLDGVRAFKDGAVKKLTDGLAGMAKTRNVEVVKGTAKFTGANTLDVDGTEVAFEHAIIAVGSQAVALPDLPDDPRIVDSTGALELPDVPERLLVIGGGIIGLEMATVHDALGSKVVVVEMLDQLMAGADPDVVKPLRKRIEKRYEAIHTGTKVEAIKATDDGIVATYGGNDETFDRVLVAVGRRPNGGGLDADKAGVEVDERGFISVDEQMRTNVEPHLRDRRRGRRADARPQGHARGQGRGRGDRGRERRLRRQGDPERRLHRPRGRLDGADRGQGQGGRHRGRDRGVPVGRLRARDRHGPHGGHDQARARARSPSGCSARASSASTPAS